MNSESQSQNKQIYHDFWSFFYEQSPEQKFVGQVKTDQIPTDHINPKFEQNNQISNLLESGINSQKECRNIEKIIHKKSNHKTNILCTKTKMSQNKNVPKFVARLFQKYHKKFDGQHRNSSRINEINQVLQNYETRGKIQLNFFKFIFNQSRFSQINRSILHKILGDAQIMNQELFFNGNVKNKKDYLYACKLIRLRCRSGILIQRAQSR